MEYNKFDLTAIILYLAALGLIGFILYEFWSLAVVFLLILMITILHKINTEKSIREINEKRVRMVGLIEEKMDSFSHKIEEVKKQIHNEVVTISNELVKEQGMELRQLSRKVIDIENRVSEIKRRLDGEDVTK